MTTPTTRPPLHGAELVMALPLFAAGRISSYVIVAATHHEYVMTTVNSLSDPEWGQGRYFLSLSAEALERAVKAAYVRAGVHLMPWTEIAEKVQTW